MQDPFSAIRLGRVGIASVYANVEFSTAARVASRFSPAGGNGTYLSTGTESS